MGSLSEFTVQKSCLSDKAIMKYLGEGEIIIEPFVKRHLNTSSYDVTLGDFYYREQKLNDWETGVYNMYSESMVKKVWGDPIKAEPYKNYISGGLKLENISPDEKIILIKPGERILAHTNEFIGGVTKVTTQMKARSSLGRNFIETCSCAGWGDVGYFNRWTMEITNNSMNFTIPLVVGRRIAQIVFFDTDGVLDSDNLYGITGKYQQNGSLDDLINNWNPESMLPKMYNDYEIKKQE